MNESIFDGPIVSGSEGLRAGATGGVKKSRDKSDEERVEEENRAENPKKSSQSILEL